MAHPHPLVLLINEVLLIGIDPVGSAHLKNDTFVNVCSKKKRIKWGWSLDCILLY